MEAALPLRLPWALAFIVTFFVLSLFVSIVVEAGLGEVWKIENPTARWHFSTSSDNGDPGEFSSSSSSSTSSPSSPLFFQLEYAVSDRAKVARYRIFQKGCREEYKLGREPVLARGPLVLPSTTTTPTTEGDNLQGTAEIMKAVPKSPMYSPTFQPSLTNPKEQIVVVRLEVPKVRSSQSVVEFCVRLGLFLPPAAGDTEVNFRETDVTLTFESDSDDEHVVDGSSNNIRSESTPSLVDTVWSFVSSWLPLSWEDVRLKSVHLEPCPLREVDIRIMGGPTTKKEDVEKEETIQEDKATEEIEDADQEGSETTEEQSTGEPVAQEEVEVKEVVSGNGNEEL